MTIKRLVLFMLVMVIIFLVWQINQTKTFLILLQNNQELRPVGGFMGSYAIFKTKGFKILDLKVNDIYEPDGKITYHINPPAPIQEAFQLGTWRLRDANWDPDFKNTAEILDWFFDKAGVEKTDYLIAINFLVAEDLIKLLEPIYISDYKETVTLNNLWNQIQSNVQNDYFPGSKQKPEFLGDLTSSLEEKFFSSSLSTKFKAIKLLFADIKQKQIMFWARNAKTQFILEKLNWAGRVEQKNDSLMIVEANLGVNKANCCVTRQVNLEIKKEGNILNHVLTINFQNNLPQNEAEKTWGGKYKAWVRILTPDKGNDHGFWVDVSVGETKTYTVEYETPLAKTLLIQKQSGLRSIPFEIVYKDGEKSTIKKFDLYNDKILPLRD